MFLKNDAYKKAEKEYNRQCNMIEDTYYECISNIPISFSIIKDEVYYTECQDINDKVKTIKGRYIWYYSLTEHIPLPRIYLQFHMHRSIL